MCYPAGEFLVGAGDVLLGHVGDAPFYIGALQAEAWGVSGGDMNLLLDAVPGRGGMFSLDNGREQRFLIRSGACAV
jgi:uncharacterized protein (DUF779 family)